MESTICEKKGLLMKKLALLLVLFLIGTTLGLSPCFAATNRFLILVDLHAGDVADGSRQVFWTTQDGSDWRVFSNWSDRVSEACKVGVLHKADFFVLLGDSIDSDDSDPVTTWATVINQVEAEYCVPAGGAVIPVFGNHEYAHASMEVSDWYGTWKAELGVGCKAGSDTTWPKLALGNMVTSARWASTNFHLITVWGAGLEETIWDNTGVAFEGANTNAAAQLDWLENTALGGITKPVIVFSHQHLSDSDGLVSTPAAILSGTPDNGNTPLQTILSDCGQKVTCFSGHYHRVAPADEKIWEKDTINLTANGGSVVDYYNLRGSILGNHASDMRGNTFFLVDIDTVVGVTSIRPFRYSDSSRDRYNSNDLDDVMGTQLRGRERY